MANNHGGARPGSGPKPTALNINRIIALRAQGFAYAEIARRFSVGVGVITRALARHNSESKQ